MENTVDSGLNKENIPLYMRVYEYYKDLITEAVSGRKASVNTAV